MSHASEGRSRRRGRAVLAATVLVVIALLGIRPLLMIGGWTARPADWHSPSRLAEQMAKLALQEVLAQALLEMAAPSPAWERWLASAAEPLPFSLGVPASLHLARHHLAGWFTPQLAAQARLLRTPDHRLAHLLLQTSCHLAAPDGASIAGQATATLLVGLEITPLLGPDLPPAGCALLVRQAGQECLDTGGLSLHPPQARLRVRQGDLPPERRGLIRLEAGFEPGAAISTAAFFLDAPPSLARHLPGATPTELHRTGVDDCLILLPDLAELLETHGIPARQALSGLTGLFTRQTLPLSGPSAPLASPAFDLARALLLGPPSPRTGPPSPLPGPEPAAWSFAPPSPPPGGAPFSPGRRSSGPPSPQVAALEGPAPELPAHPGLDPWADLTGARADLERLCQPALPIRYLELTAFQLSVERFPAPIQAALVPYAGPWLCLDAMTGLRAPPPLPRFTDRLLLWLSRQRPSLPLPLTSLTISPFGTATTAPSLRWPGDWGDKVPTAAAAHLVLGGPGSAPELTWHGVQGISGALTLGNPHQEIRYRGTGLLVAAGPISIKGIVRKADPEALLLLVSQSGVIEIDAPRVEAGLIALTPRGTGCVRLLRPTLIHGAIAVDRLGTAEWATGTHVLAFDPAFAPDRIRHLIARRRDLDSPLLSAGEQP
ncbi:MAG: hypothetical protein OZSIB_1093 [Candidatus Ozemobacter sibiricus]|jgi:hypothetical protein|uniref:Uncharacterized protein n=1 Tax=Candidatus Ozemobacter sibiricus TaxID=2268124 RepID=A0A367ZL18_9BACT|nr:MAG: hypothetical protein OZSIB_1093 [Candidatus Ozemobacter sibiricus]